MSESNDDVKWKKEALELAIKAAGCPQYCEGRLVKDNKRIDILTLILDDAKRIHSYLFSGE
jgi:hypothetical protein